MKAWFLLPAFLLGACASSPPTSPPAPPSAEPRAPVTAARFEPTPPPPPLADVAAPPEAAFAEQTLPNGLRVVAVRIPSAPTVLVRLQLPAGSATEPAQDRGSTFIAVASLGEFYERDRNGRRVRGEKSLRRQLFEMGSLYEFGVTPDEAFLQIDTPPKKLNQTLSRLFEGLGNPRRSTTIFHLYRESLMHRAESLEPEDPAAFAEAIVRGAFGPQHPYGRPVFGTIPELERLTREAVNDRQDQLLSPAGSTLYLLGNFVPERAIFSALRAVRAWPARRPTRQASIPPVRPPRSTEVSAIPIRHAELVWYCAARPLGELEGTADRATWEAVARIIGGGLGSRSATRLRSELGLSYASQGQLVVRGRSAALLVCSQSRAQRSAEAVDALVAMIAELGRRAPSPEELDTARAQLRSEHERLWHHPSALAAALAERGASVEKLRSQQAALSSLTPETVAKRMAKLADLRAWRFIFTGPKRATIPLKAKLRAAR